MSSDEKVDLVAIISPKPEKLDYIIERLSKLANFILENEPEVLRYQLHREYKTKDGSVDLVIIEQYENMAAFQTHTKQKEFVDFVESAKKEEALMKPIVLKFLKPIAGFASRL